jgi:hypothetical protein
VGAAGQRPGFGTPMTASRVPGDVSSTNTAMRGLVFRDDAVERAPAFFARLRADELALPFSDLDFGVMACRDSLDRFARSSNG